MALKDLAKVEQEIVTMLLDHIVALAPLIDYVWIMSGDPDDDRNEFSGYFESRISPEDRAKMEDHIGIDESTMIGLGSDGNSLTFWLGHGRGVELIYDINFDWANLDFANKVFAPILSHCRKLFNLLPWEETLAGKKVLAELDEFE